MNATGGIGSRAFYGCKELTTLTLADTVSSIGSYLCYGNDKLATVTLGKYIPTIPDSAFRLCPSLVNITIPRFTTTIAANAFAENTALTNVYIPPSVTSIQTSSFSYPGRMTFYGKSGSTTQTYAESRGIAFATTNAPITSLAFQSGTFDADRSKIFFIPLAISPTFDTDTLTFASSDTKIATVNATTGSVNTKAYGTTEITATNGTRTATCTLTVRDMTVYVTDITLSKSTLDLDLGRSEALAVTFLPANAENQNLTWTTSNVSVATVTNGLVKAVGLGTATITVKSEDGNITKTCTVKVAADPLTKTTYQTISAPSGLRFTVKPAKAEKPLDNGEIWLAVYNKQTGRFMTLQKTPCNGSSSYTINTSLYSNVLVKVFVWDDIAEMTSLGFVEIVNIH